MPNIKSAKQRVLVNQKKALQNKAVKTNLKTVMKKAASEGTADAIRLAIKRSIRLPRRRFCTRIRLRTENPR